MHVQAGFIVNVRFVKFNCGFIITAASQTLPWTEWADFAASSKKKKNTANVDPYQLVAKLNHLYRHFNEINRICFHLFGRILMLLFAGDL